MLANLPPIVPRVLGQGLTWFASRKAPTLAAAGVLIVLIVALAVSSRLNTLTPLFAAPLHPSQTLEVERALTIWNESFTADAQHTQLFVPALHRRDVLLRLTLAGLPHRFVPTTSEVLEQQESAFAPQSIVDDRRRAGIEGDLVAGLRRSNGVADATVVIAPAVADPLLGDDTRAPASASVQLVMQSGAVLTPSAISGMKRFVAAAYPGLSPDRVVIVDGTGSLAGAQITVDRAATREQRLQNSIQSALDEVFGAGAAIVRVSLRSSGLERTSQSTRVTPHGLLESDSGKEHGSDGGKHFERDRDRARYAYDTVVENQASHADAVAHVAVAVFLDARKVGSDQVSTVKELVRAAAGADLGAGDDVAVQALPFVSAGQPVTRRTLPASVLRFAAAAMIVISLGIGCWFVRALRMAAHAGERQTAAAMLGATLERELPQTTAYVLSSMPATVRAHVLREYPPELRQQIERHMNGHAHG